VHVASKVTVGESACKIKVNVKVHVTSKVAVGESACSK
jgi:hypothetical protein